MTDEDRAIIRRLAEGDKSARNEAVQIYHRELRATGVDTRGDPFFDFMSEIDNPCPCWVLKSQARDKILAS